MKGSDGIRARICQDHGLEPFLSRPPTHGNDGLRSRYLRRDKPVLCRVSYIP